MRVWKSPTLGLRPPWPALALSVVVGLGGYIWGAMTVAPPAPAAVATPLAPPTAPPPTATPTPVVSRTPTPIPPAARGFVPILCYHHVRDWQRDDSEEDRAYIVPPATFEAHLRYLRAHGYHSVSAEQVYQYYAHGQPLPDKPIMLSFDDNDATSTRTPSRSSSNMASRRPFSS